MIQESGRGLFLMNALMDVRMRKNDGVTSPRCRNLLDLRAALPGGDQQRNRMRGIINEMIAKEEPLTPLSDEEIVTQLKAKGIVIARRTVAKYRSELNILPSHLRRKY